MALPFFMADHPVPMPSGLASFHEALQFGVTGISQD